MKMLDLLNDDNIKKAITYLLNSDLEESESYKQKQRFTKLSTEDELPKIVYISQKEHAIDWIFSKTVWHKAKNNGSIDLAKLINDIQCTPLLLYLAIVVDLITEDDAENYINEITDKLEECSNITSKNVRFKEKKALINVIGENWSKAIANKLIQ